MTGMMQSIRLLTKCKNKGELLIVIQDTKGNIFGGYFSQNLQMKESYYGTGESFLFKVTVTIGLLQEEGVVIYHSTMENLYYCYCNMEGIGFGSDPHYGLFIENCLTRGSSHSCRTFGNDPLSSSKYFVIQKLEIFTFKYNTE